MQTPTPEDNRLIRSWTLIPLAAALALGLAGCGGGGGGTSSGVVTPTAATTLQGAVNDAPIANATVTITVGAPLGQTGASTVGQITTDAGGNYTVQVTLPNSTAPVFANATSPDGKVVLTAYLGASNAVSAAGTLSPTQLPNLVISQVSTAVLAIYVASGGSYANLTPTLYAGLLAQYHDDILSLSAAIKAVADGYCAMPSGHGYKDTEDMAHGIASDAWQQNNQGGAVLGTASTQLGSCNANLQNLMQYIASDDKWVPELDEGDLMDSFAPAVAPGAYSLQGVLVQSGMSASAYTPPALPASSASMPAPIPATPLPPAIVSDSTVSVDASGNVTSSDGVISGKVFGNHISLSVNGGAAGSYTLAGKLGMLPSTYLTTAGIPATPASSASGTTVPAAPTTGYSLRMGGATLAGGVLTRFDAVLVPVGSQPAWAQITQTTTSRSDGLVCSSGEFGVRLMGTGATVGGLVLGACAAPQTDGLLLTSAGTGSSSDHFNDDDLKPGVSIGFTGFGLSNSTMPATPYILNAPTVTIAKNGPTPSSSSSLDGQMFYVMGARDMIFSNTSANALFVMNDNPLDTLPEQRQGGGY